MTEDEERARLIAEARTWLGTRYLHAAQVKARRDEAGYIVDRGGVDCAMFVYRAFLDAGLIEPLQIPIYSAQWMLHRDEEKYMNFVLGRAAQVDVSQPGDVALFRFGRTFAHGAIITEAGWPAIIHSYSEAGFVLEGRGDQGRLAGRPIKFFSRWAS